MSLPECTIKNLLSELEVLSTSFMESTSMTITLCNTDYSPLVGTTGATYRFKVDYQGNKQIPFNKAIIGWHGTSIENVIKIIHEGKFDFSRSRDNLIKKTIYIANARLLQYEKQLPDHPLKNLRSQLIVELDTSNLSILGYPDVEWSPLKELHCSQQSFGEGVCYRIREILIWKDAL